ncbi:MAG: hypothetical protein KC444_00830 [Nitrosopumilus sp.]|nr:hypothetical protein [Nitrosopumilus sp.]
MKPPTYSTMKLIGELRKTIDEYNQVKETNSERAKELKQRIKSIQQELEIPFNDSELV